MTVPASISEKTDSLAGMPPLRRERRWDHTYVVCNHGLSWGCFGRSQDGYAICRGTGDPSFADCLAREDGQAGISYLVNGVCHQAANRILYPARVTVSKARGYTISSSIYGDYGLGSWLQLDKCLDTHDDISGYVSGSRGLEEAPAPFIIAPQSNGLEEHNPMLPLPGKYQDDPRRTALRNAIDVRLGINYDLEKRRRLLDVQLNSFPTQDDLIDSFEKNKISADEYFVELTKLTKECFSKYEAILGKDDFLKLFDCLPSEVPPPGDPELFAHAYGLSTPPKVPD